MRTCVRVPMQGGLDPLNDARGRSRDLTRLCPEFVTTTVIEAGHCPHDEQPGQVCTCERVSEEGRVL